MPQGSDTTQAHLWFWHLQTKSSPNTLSTLHSPSEGTVLHKKMKPVKDISKQCEKSNLQAKSNLPTEYLEGILSLSSWRVKTQGYIHVRVFLLVSCVLINLAQWKRSVTPPLKFTAGEKQGKFMGMVKRDSQNRSTGLGGNEDMMCGTGGIWEWKTWKRLFALGDTPLYLNLCSGTGSTSTTQLCHYMSYVCATEKRKPGADLWLWRQLS